MREKPKYFSKFFRTLFFRTFSSKLKFGYIGLSAKFRVK